MHKNPFWRVKHPQRVTPINNTPNIQNPSMPPVPGSYPPGAPQPNYGGFSPPPSDHSAAMMMPPPSSQIFAYEASQDIEGHVIITMPPGKKTEHLGIRVQFIGRIDMSVGIHEGKPHYDFVSLAKELSPPGALYQQQTVLPFRFKNMEKELESYRGRNVSVRYMVQFVMERKFVPPLRREHDVWVQLLQQAPSHDEPIKMEVGIEDCLHIEFEYERRHYHLLDTIRGQINFLLVRIKIKYMELAVLRRETSGEGVLAAAGGAGANPPPNQGNSDANNIFTETQTLIKYEIMDGAPVKGVSIPVKLSLAGIPADLTPTYTAVNNRFSVRYFLNLVLVDEDDRRYFKQQEIILWRKELG
eukprot:CAMPEP_0172446698 /NCGR_PEP_ID=MMETSP1065-20121228/6252_1 /TAXON_ID=265537 /ORGANISM="Amphiprora paludosa, Strain CCMP125" /LENGTH=356 /DNA_ID=CAMNT_0013197887 /DNA_START=392 /DNA_END=1462 /DNA_ORIENTATION=-